VPAMRFEVSGNGKDGSVAAGLRVNIRRKLQAVSLPILRSAVGKGAHALWAVAATYFQADPSFQEGFAGFLSWPAGEDGREPDTDTGGRQYDPKSL